MMKLAMVAALSAAIGAGAATAVMNAKAQSRASHDFLVAGGYLYVIDRGSGMVSLCSPSADITTGMLGMTCSDPISIP